MRHGVAKISNQDCILLVPADTPYDFQALMDELEWRGTRGPTRLELDGRTWVVLAPSTEPIRCARCTQPVRLRYVNSSHITLCTACARSEFRASGRWGSLLRTAATS